jgi:hypothetical protein
VRAYAFSIPCRKSLGAVSTFAPSRPVPSVTCTNEFVSCMKFLRLKLYSPSATHFMTESFNRCSFAFKRDSV